MNRKQKKELEEIVGEIMDKAADRDLDVFSDWENVKDEGVEKIIKWSKKDLTFKELVKEAKKQGYVLY